MKTPQLSFTIASRIFAALLLMATPLFLTPQTANAAQLTTRSLTLVADTAGGSAPYLGAGDLVKHNYVFSSPAVGTNLGSIRFQYCTTAANSVANPLCVPPPGLDTTGVTRDSESGATGWNTTNTPSANEFWIGRTAAALTDNDPNGTNTIISLGFSGIVPPTATNTTFFVRITTYQGNDGVTSPVDAGVVAASTATPIEITGTMPESLVFCTGRTVPVITATTVPDCAGATSGAIGFDKLFSPTDTAAATSQMAASTNATYGYVITVNGTTLTSGSNPIAGMVGGAGASVASTRGTAQFGLNLVANTTTVASGFGADALDITTDPNSCQTTPANAGCAAWLASDNYADSGNIATASDGTGYRGQPLLGYRTVDQFRFNSGDSVANSLEDDADPSTVGTSAQGGTDGQIFTVSYIANVPGNLPAGTYTTTLTYICTPTF
jgi:hypothetical protein